MIIKAATPLIIEHGEMVTTKQIAEAACIAEGTIFRVFPDKDAVIAAAVEAAIDHAALEWAIEEIDRTLPLEQRVEAAVVVLQRQVVDVWRLISRVGVRFREHPPKRPPDSNALVALIGGCGELRVKPAVAARVLFGLTLTGTHPMFVDKPMKPGEIVTLFLHGAAGSSPC
jgi:AcrR family transcriptional regulator